MKESATKTKSEFPIVLVGKDRDTLDLIGEHMYNHLKGIFAIEKYTNRTAVCDRLFESIKLQNHRPIEALVVYGIESRHDWAVSIAEGAHDLFRHYSPKPYIGIFTTTPSDYSNLSYHIKIVPRNGVESLEVLSEQVRKHMIGTLSKRLGGSVGLHSI